MDHYPIPVISVKGYCDVEISPDGISVTTKKKRKDALDYSFERLKGYSFEAFGVEGYKERHITGSCENAMHLIRLYLMCLDILEREEIVTLREKDHDLLMDIRNGRYQKADHTFSTDFYDLLNELERRLDYGAKYNSLPEAPDLARIEAFQMEVNERVVRDEI